MPPTIQKKKNGDIVLRMSMVEAQILGNLVFTYKHDFDDSPLDFMVLNQFEQLPIPFPETLLEKARKEFKENRKMCDMCGGWVKRTLLQDGLCPICINDG